MKVLLITHSPELVKLVKQTLEEYYQKPVALTCVDHLQDAIEGIEQKRISADLALIEQKTSSSSVLKLFLALSSPTPSVVLYADEGILNDLKSLEEQARFIGAATLEVELPLTLKKLEATGKIIPRDKPEREYVPIEAARILKINPIPADVYLELSSGKHLKIFQKGDEVFAKDLEKYKGQEFFLTRTDCDQVLKNQVQTIETIAEEEPLDPIRAQNVSDIAQDLVRSLVSEVGFTEDAQRIAKASVNMSLKLIGTKPRLSTILKELKKKDSNFVSTHSFLLGQVACAMAHTVGWNSAPTYFKLSMAAFLHDISLNIPTREQEHTFDEAVKSGVYKSEELKILRFHPTQSAEYTQQFSEIPVDVAQIVAQHHERPNGSGYPRGLSSKYISPLSALFILAHDLIVFMMKYPDAKVEKFYELYDQDYQASPFRKIFVALKASANSTRQNAE